MITVAIDTSQEVCVAVTQDGRAAGRVLADRRAHAEQLLPLLQAAAAEVGVTLDQVDRVIVGVGPGPFTGLRVGVAAAATLAEATSAEIRGVGSLDAIAKQWTDAPEEFVVVADARRKEVYWATYSGSGIRRSGPYVTAPELVPELPVAGPGAAVLGRVAAGPTALDPVILAEIGPELESLGLEPLYLRRPDAEVSTRRKSTLVRRRR